MDSFEATAHVINTLEDSGVDYMLVGALSSNAYGIPRATKDADVVVSFDSIGIVEFARRLGEEFRLDRQMRIETVTGSVRNIITFTPTNFDIEFFRLSKDEHHQQRFARRQRQWLRELQREAWIPTAEDVVIQKMRWGRFKDLDDVQNLLGVCGGKLDWEYIRRWTAVHGTLQKLDEMWASIPHTDVAE